MVTPWWLFNAGTRKKQAALVTILSPKLFFMQHMLPLIGAGQGD